MSKLKTENRPFISLLYILSATGTRYLLHKKISTVSVTAYFCDEARTCEGFWVVVDFWVSSVGRGRRPAAGSGIWMFLVFAWWVVEVPD